MCKAVCVYLWIRHESIRREKAHSDQEGEGACTEHFANDTVLWRKVSLVTLSCFDTYEVCKWPHVTLEEMEFG